MDTVKIGKFLAELRREKGMTQRQLAQKLRVSDKTISRWETGSYLPDAEMLLFLSEEFGVSINMILTGERFDEEEYCRRAEANLVTVLRESRFTVREQMAFWQKKWQRDNLSWRITGSIAAGGGYAVLLLLNHPGWAGLWMVSVLFAWLRSRAAMAKYVEDKVFGQQNSPDR